MKNCDCLSAKIDYDPDFPDVLVCTDCGNPAHLEEIHLGDPIFKEIEGATSLDIHPHLFSDAVSGSLILAERILKSSSLDEAKQIAKNTREEWIRFLKKS